MWTVDSPPAGLGQSRNDRISLARSMNPIAKLSDLIDPLELDSPEHLTYFDRKTARFVLVDKIVMRAVQEGDDDLLNSLPDWQKPEVEIVRAILEDSADRF